VLVDLGRSLSATTIRAVDDGHGQGTGRRWVSFIEHRGDHGDRQYCDHLSDDHLALSVLAHLKDLSELLAQLRI
jgi:hypothetical protein